MNLHLLEVALRVSVTMSWPSETTEKLNMLRFDFSAGVLQKVQEF